MTDEPRTNNQLEGWHQRFKVIIQTYVSFHGSYQGEKSYCTFYSVPFLQMLAHCAVNGTCKLLSFSHCAVNGKLLSFSHFHLIFGLNFDRCNKLSLDAISMNGHGRRNIIFEEKSHSMKGFSAKSWKHQSRARDIFKSTSAEKSVSLPNIILFLD